MKSLLSTINEALLNEGVVSAQEWIEFFTMGLDEYRDDPDEVDPKDVELFDKMVEEFCASADKVKVYSSVRDYWEDCDAPGKILSKKSLEKEIETIISNNKDLKTITFQDIFTCFVYNDAFYMVANASYGGEYYDGMVKKV